MEVPPALSGFLAKGHLSRVSRQYRLSATIKGDNEMIPAAVHRSPDIYLMTEGNSGKPQLGDLMKSVTSHCLKWGSLSPNGVVRMEKHLREEKEGK